MNADPHESPKLKILYVTYNFPPKMGGLEQVVRRTWEALSQRHHVAVLAQGAKGYDGRDPSVHRPSREGLLRYFWFLATRGRRMAVPGAFDVVLSGSALTALPTVRLARRCGARSIVIIHGLDTIHPSFVYQRLVRWALPKADLVLANSRATRDEALARGVRPERARIIPPGCDAEAFLQPRDTARLRGQWGLSGCKVILSAGRLVKRKGVDRFVRECLPRVARSIPEARLLVAGGNPEGALAHKDDVLGAVWRAADEAGVRDRVVVTGRLSPEDMAAAFQLADVFVLPAVPFPGDMEGFGIVLLEAGVAGKPVVATALGGIPDAVVDGTTGSLVPPCDYAAMADRLVEFLSDPERSRRFGEAGRERALREFTWDAIQRRYLDAVEGLCAGGAGAPSTS